MTEIIYAIYAWSSFMWPQHITLWIHQENMYVHCSNKLINILRVTETHMLSRYCQEWEQSGRPVVDAPHGWT
jgi:hypothetical protein